MGAINSSLSFTKAASYTGVRSALPPGIPNNEGEVTRPPECSVGAGIMIGSRLLTGADYLLKVPAIDLAEVGASGGSLVWIDGDGSLKIGSERAGASPGPVCYDRGGTVPNVTDAKVLLGYLNAKHWVGGGEAERRHGATCVRE